MHLLTEFLKVLAPVYIFAVGLTCGLTTSAMFYHMLLVLIYLIELVAVQFLLPIIHVQVLVGVLNNLSEEDYLAKFGELLELGIKWTMKLGYSGAQNYFQRNGNASGSGRYRGRNRADCGRSSSAY